MRKRHLLIGGIIVFALVKLFGAGTPSTPSQSLSHQKPSKIQATNPPSESAQAPVSSTTRLEETTETAAVSFSSQTQTQTQTQELPVRFVRGNAVAFRDAPSPQGKILDRIDRNHAVTVLEAGNDWTRIRDALTQREGWIATRFLANGRDTLDKPTTKPVPPEKPTLPNIPSIPDTTIIQRIITESVAGYSGSCACPYSTDRGGRRCGNRSAYSKPGGYAPICYPQDVTKAMIEAFRGR